jgi:Zn-dependent metalloprotease
MCKGNETNESKFLCGFSKHLSHLIERIRLCKVTLNTMYSGSCMVYIKYQGDQSPPRGTYAQLCSFNHGINITVLDVNENELDVTQTYPISYLKTCKPKTIDVNKAYYECDILVNCYEYMDFIREYGIKFPFNDLFILSGVNELENAYYNGSYMVFGNGKTGKSFPLVSPEIIGHELTHAVIQSIPKLDYWNESGSLNEAYADIFGVMFMFWIQEKKTSLGWEVGDQVFVDGAMRSFKDPHSYGCPTSIHDKLYYTGSMDNGGIHTNSSVITHLFYKIQLVEGDKKIIFRMFINIFNKLKHDSKFVDFKHYLLDLVYNNHLRDIINESI